MNIFLTGASGTIGGEVCARLISAGHSVVALVRQASDIYANDGRLLTADAFSGVMPDAGCISTIAGDISYPHLAMGAEITALLRRHIDLVIHSAAITDFNASEAIYQSVNIDGVTNILDSFPDTRLLHISTAYVCGPKDGPVAEGPCDTGQKFSNGYESSKAAGEALILAASTRAVIARPGIVVGAYNDGAMRRFDTFYQLFRLIAEGHISHLPASDTATLDFVPIDHVVSGLMDIIDNWNMAEGNIVHLTSGSAIPATMLADAIGLFDHLGAPSFVAPEEFEMESLPKAERRLYRRFAAFYSDYLQRRPAFVTGNLQKISGRCCPVIDLAYMERLTKYCIENGFIRNS